MRCGHYLLVLFIYAAIRRHISHYATILQDRQHAMRLASAYYIIYATLKMLRHALFTVAVCCACLRFSFAKYFAILRRYRYYAIVYA